MNNEIFQFLSTHRNKHLEELTEYLAIPSISSLPEHKEDVKKAAEWTANALKEAGIENVTMYETNGHPVVYGDWLKQEGKPTVLVYGHYDVQPVDPLELWDTPPFEANIRDNKIYARGASDDKGQVFMHIKAIEAILRTTGSLPVNFKFCIEGEEEIGSPALPQFVEQNKDLLAADVIVISDTGMQGPGKPAICYGLRGLCGLQIDVTGANSDLHSGLYGGAVQNSIHALVEIVNSFHSPEGKVLVEGFYDNVQEITEEERKAFAALGNLDEELKEQLGVSELHGEPGFTTSERTFVRPTLEVNGIYGGFQGEGIKTVIPAKATAKITCRLVPNQDPAEIANLLTKHIYAHVPAGVAVNVSLFDQGHPYVTPLDHPAIVAAFDQILGLPVVLMGFGLSTENFHAPNEHFHLENFDKGLETICTYWFELAKSLK